MERENREEFVSDAIDIGFKVLDNNERVTYSDVELMYMEQKKKEKYLSGLENTPDTVLFNPENNVVIELFEENGEVVQANAIFKYSVSSLKNDVISRRMNDIGETLINQEEFKGGSFSHLMKIKLEDIGCACDIEEVLKSPAVFQEKIEFKDEQINAFTFMENFEGSARDKTEKLNQMFGDDIGNIIQYQKGFNPRMKVTR